jgi:vesicle-fusing ATPase
MQVEQNDFERALQEVKPAFGQSDDLFSKFSNNEIINYGEQWENLENKIQEYIDNFKSSDSIINTFRVLMYGDSGSGKTTISSYMAMKSKFPYIKIISSSSFVGYGEMQKINIIRKIFTDAYQSKESVIILDDIERLIEFSEYGNRYSNAILQIFLVLINENTKKNNKLLIIGTCKNIHIMDLLELKEQFDIEIKIPNIESTCIPYIYEKLNKKYDVAITDSIPIKKLITQTIITHK